MTTARDEIRSIADEIVLGLRATGMLDRFAEKLAWPVIVAICQLCPEAGRWELRDIRGYDMKRRAADMDPQFPHDVEEIVAHCSRGEFAVEIALVDRDGGRFPVAPHGAFYFPRVEESPR